MTGNNIILQCHPVVEVHAVFSRYGCSQKCHRKCVEETCGETVGGKVKLVYWKFDTQGSIVLTARREKIWSPIKTAVDGAWLSVRWMRSCAALLRAKQAKFIIALAPCSGTGEWNCSQRQALRGKVNMVMIVDKGVNICFLCVDCYGIINFFKYLWNALTKNGHEFYDFRDLRLFGADFHLRCGEFATVCIQLYLLFEDRVSTIWWTNF